MEFIFDVDRPRIRDGTNIGERVKLWIAKGKEPENVFIYYPDGPQGLLGFVPSEYFDIIASHLMASMDYEASIVGLSYDTCAIKCRLITTEETERRKEEYKASLKKELIKPYTTQKPIILRIVIRKKKAVKVGDKLLIEFGDLDSYGPGPKPWQIRFLNQAGDTIGNFAQNRSIIQRLLKAHFNSYHFDVEVLDIEKTSVRVWDNIPPHKIWKGYPTQLAITPLKIK